MDTVCNKFFRARRRIRSTILRMNGSPHILVVDDHREIRELVSRILTKEGFRVTTAQDGQAMRKVLADARIDLVLLDIMMPGEDGLAICRSLRATSQMPVIMLTAKGEELDRVTVRIEAEEAAEQILFIPKVIRARTDVCD